MGAIMAERVCQLVLLCESWWLPFEGGMVHLWIGGGAWKRNGRGGVGGVTTQLIRPTVTVEAWEL